MISPSSMRTTSACSGWVDLRTLAHLAEAAMDLDHEIVLRLEEDRLGAEVAGGKPFEERDDLIGPRLVDGRRAVTGDLLHEVLVQERANRFEAAGPVDGVGVLDGLDVGLGGTVPCGGRRDECGRDERRGDLARAGDSRRCSACVVVGRGSCRGGSRITTPWRAALRRRRPARSPVPAATRRRARHAGSPSSP